MIKLKLLVQQYLQLPLEHIDILFKIKDTVRIHIAYSLTKEHFVDTGTHEERILFFKSKL